MKNNDTAKKINSCLALLLIICVLLASISSCSKDNAETAEIETTMSVETDTADADSANTSDTSLPELSEVLPDELDFEGLTIRYYLEDQPETYLLGDLEGDVVNAAVATVNQRVSEFLNVGFSVEKVVPVFEMSSAIQKMIRSGDDNCDVCVIQRWCSAGMAPLGYFKDVSSLPHLNLENPWWASAYIDAMSYNGTYLLTSDMCTNYIGGTYAIFANMRIWDALNLPDIYGIVLDGTWTIDKMTDYAKNAWQDLNGNGQTDDEDQLGYVYNFTEELATGLGVKYCDRDEKGVPYLSMMNEHTVDVWEKLYRLYVETPGSCNALANNKEDIDYFRNGSALFMDRMFCYSNMLRDMEDDYYIVPTPKFDEAQENYISLNAGNGAQYGIPVTAQNTEAIGAVLEALALESRRITRPAYYDLTLGEKIARDNESKKMINLIQDTVFVDFGYCYAKAIGSGYDTGSWEVLFDFFRTIGSRQENNPVSLYESKKSQYEQHLADLLEAFENIKK